MRKPLLLAGVFAYFACASGCASRVMFDVESGSLSYAASNSGAVFRPAMLTQSGLGYTTPEIWHLRGSRYGTEELVSFIEYLGKALDKAGVKSPLAVADLSAIHGGRTQWHKSHQSGRDVDLVLFAKTPHGEPMLADQMLSFESDGTLKAIPIKSEPTKNRKNKINPPKPEPPRERIFDDAANWELVKALVQNPIAQVQYIFIADVLKIRLLMYAQKNDQPADLIEAAGVLMRQPADSAIHDDHLHIRILCSPEDATMGCQDAGDFAWYKKHRKYPKTKNLVN